MILIEWKKIDGYENYSVSSKGNVRNDKTGRILKSGYKKDGYKYVNLCKNGKHKRFLVHRLVAKAFIPNPDNLPCIDHINTIRDDNYIDNLRWCTHKENCNNPLTLENHSKAHKGENHPNYGKHLSEEHKQKISEAKKGKNSDENNPRCRKVICITTGEVFDYIKQASEKYRVAKESICSCCKGKLKSAGKLNGEKLVWRYLEDFL